MKKLLPLIWAAGLSLLLSLPSFAQTYPHPTFSSLTVTGATATQSLTVAGVPVTGGGSQNCPTIESLGGGTSVSDNGVPLNAAMAAWPSGGGCIWFGTGTYTFTTAVTHTFPNAPSSAMLLGNGAEGTILKFTAPATATLWTYASVRNSVHIRDMSFTTGTANVNSNAITLFLPILNNNGVVEAPNDITSVHFHGADGLAVTDFWGLSVLQKNVSNVTYFQDNFIGANVASVPAGKGIEATGISSIPSFILTPNVLNCTFGVLDYSIIIDPYVYYAVVQGSDFTDVNHGILITAVSPGFFSLQAIGNEFNTNVGTIEATAGGAVIGAGTISGNAFQVELGVAINGNLQATSVTGNWFAGPATPGSTVALSFLSGSNHNIVTGNTFAGFGEAIGNNAGSTTLNVQSNIYNGNTNNIVNAGSLQLGGSCAGLGGTCAAGASN